FRWRINGTDGTLRITADAAQPQIFPLTVAGAHGLSDPTELPVPAASTYRWPALTSLEGTPAYNVGRAYAAFAADMDNGTHTVPDFADAVRRHEVIAASSCMKFLLVRRMVIEDGRVQAVGLTGECAPERLTPHA